MKTLRKFLASLLSVSMVVTPAYAADSFTIRLPILAAVHNSTTTAYDFGSAIVGTQPARVFSFTNRSAKPTQMGALVVSGKAKVLEHSCVGTLQSNESCDITMAVNVDTAGTNSGAVSVSHSEGSTPDIWSLSATGVTSGSTIRFDEPSVNFGEQLIRTASPTRSLTLRNKGTQSVELTSLTLRNSTNFAIVENQCEGELAAGSSCAVVVEFRPQLLGALGTTISYTLGNGTTVSTASTLAGVGVQGYPSWSAAEINFIDVPAGTVAPAQSLTLTNTGKGTLGISSLEIPSGGDSEYFRIKSTTCPGQLLPQTSCQVAIEFMAPDTAVRSSTLQLLATGTTLPTTRVQLFARPAETATPRPVLTVEPSTLAFGNQPVGVAKVMNLTLKSVGTAPVSVTGYTLNGAAASDFRLLNASTCTGTLNAGMQCVLQVEVNPSAGGARSASLTLAHTSAEPVSAVPLTVTGQVGVLEATPAVVTFPTTEAGKTATQSVTLKNVGAAPLKLNTLSFSSAQTGVAGMFSSSTNCTGQTLAVGSSCVLTLTYAPSTVASHNATLTLAHNGEGGTTAVALAGAGKAPVVPVSALSTFSCPAPAAVGQSIVCTATLSNPGAVAWTFTGVGTSSNTAMVPSMTGCTSPMAPGGTCTVRLTGTFTSAGPVSTTYQLVTSAQTLSAPVALTIEAPRGTLTVADHGAVQLNVQDDATHTLTNTGNLPLSLTLPARIAVGSSSAYSVVSSNCPATLAAGAACSVVTRCTPTAVGPQTGTLAVTSNASAAIQGALSCLAEAPPASNADLSLNPTTLNFGNKQIGSSSTLNVLVKNNGLRAVTVSGFSVVGAHTSSFTAAAGNCATLAAGATCGFTVTAKPEVAGLRTAGIRVLTNALGTPPEVATQVTGVSPELLVTPSAVAFGAVTTGSSRTVGIRLTNPGSVDTSVSTMSITVGGANFQTTGLCRGRVLPPGSFCDDFVRFNATGTGASEGTLSIGFNGSNSPLTVALTGNQTAPVTPLATLTIRPHGSVPLGRTGEATHTISNTGTLGVTLSTSPSVLGTGFALIRSTCTATLAAGATCDLVTRCAPGVVGPMTGTLTVSSNVTPALTGALSCTGEPAALEASKVTLSPNPLSFGALKVGASSANLAVQVRNGNGFGTPALSLNNFVLGGSHASDFTVASRGTCGASLSAGASCFIYLSAKPSMLGARTATLTLDSNAQGTAPSIDLNATGGAAAFSVTPTSVSFGTVTGGSAVPVQTVTIRNTGTLSAQIVSFVPLANHSAAISYGGTCTAGMYLAAGNSCTRTVVLNSATVFGPQTGGFTVNFSDGLSPAVVTVDANVTAIPKPAGTLSLSCPATAPLGTTITCTATVQSTGDKALNLYSWYVSRVVGTTSQYLSSSGSLSCTSGTQQALPPGQSCTQNFTVTPTAQGLSTFRLQGNADAVLAAVTATTDVLGPKISLTANNHPATQVFASSTATHTVTNTGPTTVNLSNFYTSSAAISVDRTGCPAYLNSGQSCSVTTTCRPTAPGSIAATLYANGSAYATAPFTCPAEAAKVTATYDQTPSTKVGGFSTSGNWVRLTNAGVGPVALQQFVPAMGWTLYGSPSVPSNCVVGKTLLPGESCSVIEALTGTAGPGVTVTGSQRIRSSAGDLVWNSAALETLGLNFAVVTPFTDTQVGSVTTAVYSLTNRAPVATALPLVFTPAPGSGLTVQSHDCPSSLASGASCRLTLRYAAGLYPMNQMSVSLTASTGYLALLSGKEQPGTARNGVQGTLTAQFAVKAANVTLTGGTNTPPIFVGQTADITATLRNDGIGAVTVTGAPVITGAPQYTVVGGTCSANGTVLPGRDCTIVVRFAPTSGMPGAGTLTVPTSVGPRSVGITGSVYPASDVSVAVSSQRTVLVDGTMNYGLSVKNGVMGPVKVTVQLGLTNAGGSRAYISQFNGGICGTYTFNSAGAVVSQGPATTALGQTCVSRVASGQLELTLPANGLYSAGIVAMAGSEVGTATVTASATVTQATDPVLSNNTASGSTEITYPIADMSLTFGTPSTNRFGLEGTQTMLATVRVAGVPQGASGKVSFSAASLTNGAGLSITSVRCLSKSAGASCDDAGNVTLPGNGSAQYEVVVRFGGVIGKAELIGTVAMTSVRLTDTPLSNNTDRQTFDIQAIPTTKWCTFTNVPGEVGINGGQRWAAGVGPFKSALYMQGKYSPMINAADYYFSAVAYIDYNTGLFYWKGSNKPVTDAYGTQMKMGGNGPMPYRTNVFLTRVVYQDNIQALNFADGNISPYTISGSGSAIFRLPSYYPESYMNSPGVKDQSDYNSYGSLRSTLGDARVFGANWVAGFNIVGGRGAPYSQYSSCYFKSGYAFYDYPEHCYYDGYLASGSGGGKQVVWQEHSVGASCGATNAWRIR